VKYWYAIYVRSRHEKKVNQFFEEKGIESSLPLIQTSRQWSDRKKKVEIPLFRGYVFVKIDINKDKLNVLKTDGVVKFISTLNKPSRIPAEQIHWVHMMVESSGAQSEKEIPLGQKVRVTKGPFKGIKGTVMRTGNQFRLVVLMESIMHAVSVEINPNYLDEIKS
jgi:transcription antitermination factor NusG